MRNNNIGAIVLAEISDEGTVVPELIHNYLELCSIFMYLSI
jgi:hypothetical protein